MSLSNKLLLFWYDAKNGDIEINFKIYESAVSINWDRLRVLDSSKHFIFYLSSEKSNNSKC